MKDSKVESISYKEPFGSMQKTANSRLGAQNLIDFEPIILGLHEIDTRAILEVDSYKSYPDREKYQKSLNVIF
jgi:hypothetical protein